MEEFKEQLSLSEERVECEKAAMVETAKAKKRWQVPVCLALIVCSNACVVIILEQSNITMFDSDP